MSTTNHRQAFAPSRPPPRMDEDTSAPTFAMPAPAPTPTHDPSNTHTSTLTAANRTLNIANLKKHQPSRLPSSSNNSHATLIKRTSLDRSRSSLYPARTTQHGGAGNSPNKWSRPSSFLTPAPRLVGSSFEVNNKPPEFKTPRLPASNLNAHTIISSDDDRFSPEIVDGHPFSDAYTRPPTIKDRGADRATGLKRFNPPGEDEPEFVYGDVPKRFRDQENHLTRTDNFVRRDVHTHPSSSHANAGPPGVRHGSMAPAQHVPTSLDSQTLEQWSRAHPEVQQRARERWTNCTLEEWVQGAEELTDKFKSVLRIMTDDMKERQAAYKTCFEKIRQREQQLTDRGEELERTMEALRRDGEKVIEGGLKLDEPEGGDEKKEHD